MEKSKKNLKVFSTLFIFFAIWDVITFIIDCFNGSISLQIFNGEATDQVAMIAFILLIVVLAIVVLVELYLGIKGLKQAKGETKGTANVKIAKVIYFILVVLFILSVVSAIKGNLNILELANNVAGIIIVHYYIKYVNEVTEK